MTQQKVETYLYLFRGGMDMSTASPDAQQANMESWRAWIGKLVQSGHFKAGEPLDRAGKVLKGKKKSVTDGPYAEAKDLVGGYLIVKAGSINEASELAQGCPIFEADGTVEVRPILPM